MKHFCNVTEEDLFYYVFYPDQLTADKRECIDQNLDEFLEQIEFCQILKKSNISVQEKLAEPNKSKIVELFPINLKITGNSNYLVLAAASSELSKKIETKTFTDENSQILVRLVTTLEEKVLYVFSKDNSIKKAKVTLLPSNKSYCLNSSESSIKIDTSDEVEKICIEDIN